MKYLILLLSLSALSAIAAIEISTNQNRKLISNCRDNDYYCHLKINEAQSKKKPLPKNTLNQFDSALTKEVTTTLGQGFSTNHTSSK